MREEKRKFSAGKGDKPRPCNYKLFGENYEDIEWREKGTYCCSCGIKILKENIKLYPHRYTIHKDGSVECKECNYN